MVRLSPSTLALGCLKGDMDRSDRCEDKVTEFPFAFKVFLLLSTGLTIVSFVFTVVCRELKLGLPYTFPYYYASGEMFSDFSGFVARFRKWGTPVFFDHEKSGYLAYPAPLVHVLRFFIGLPLKRVCFMTTLLVVSAGLAIAFVQVLRKQKFGTMQSVLFVGSTAFLSYPLLFEIQRGNIEFLIWLFGALGIWCFLTGRTTASAVAIGVAASLKLYPFIFLGLFLPRRKYGGFLLGIATFAGVTLLSLYGIGPTIAAAARWNGEQIAAFSKYIAGGFTGIGYDHSFFALVKAFTQHWHPDYFAWAHRYSITMAIVSIALYFLRMWRLPLSNQILALSILSVTLAPVSYDYTLLNLYPAFAMLAMLAIQGERCGTHVPHLSAYMVLFALIFTPQSYIIIQGFRYGAQLRTLCMIVMLVLALVTPLPEPVEAGRLKKVLAPQRRTP
jgi:hypothetical protein